MFVYICSCTYVRVHMFVYICSCTYVRVHMFVYICSCTCVRVHAFVYICSCTYVRVHAVVYMRLYTCVRVHVFGRAYACAVVCACACVDDVGVIRMCSRLPVVCRHMCVCYLEINYCACIYVSTNVDVRLHINRAKMPIQTQTKYNRGISRTMEKQPS